MIVGLEGQVTLKTPTYIHLSLNSGITYKINISLHSISLIDLKNTIKLNITQIIREDANLLFGFLDLDEQRIFETLIKLNGIGPSTAMAVCSTLKPYDFQKAIIDGSVEAFKAVPGIGPRGAKRIIVELSDFNLLETTQIVSYQKNAFLALESLGFKKEKIQKVLQTCTSTDVQSLIKEALKKLS